MKLLALLAGLLFYAHAAASQVSAVVHLQGRDGEVRIANPTQKPLKVSLVLYRDSVGVNPPLGDSITSVRISPRQFTLQPGREQMVRLRLRQAARPGEVLRLGVTFTPIQERTAGTYLTLAVRYIVRVEAGP